MLPGYSIAIPVTPSDTVDVSLTVLQPFDALYIGVPVTNVTIMQEGGTTVTFTFPAIEFAPFILPVRGIRVMDTDTDSTSLVALYIR